MSSRPWLARKPHSTRQANARGLGRFVSSLTYLESVLNNSAGRYEAAREAARRAFEHDELGFGSFVAPELAEAASRTGDAAREGPAHAAVEEASAGNMKRTWIPGARDWLDRHVGEGREFLRHATQVKNIWIPYGE